MPETMCWMQKHMEFASENMFIVTGACTDEDKETIATAHELMRTTRFS